MIVHYNHRGRSRLLRGVPYRASCVPKTVIVVLHSDINRATTADKSQWAWVNGIGGGGVLGEGTCNFSDHAKMPLIEKGQCLVLWDVY